MTTPCTQAEFAQHIGVTKSYVTALKHAGRLVFTSDGRVDVEASKARIKATSGAPERAAPEVAGKVITDSKDRSAFYDAELKRLELDRELRKVLQTDEVLGELADFGAVLRSKIEQQAVILTPQLVPLAGDEVRIRALLVEHSHRLLKQLSDYFDAMAHMAGAPEEQQGTGA